MLITFSANIILSFSIQQIKGCLQVLDVLNILFQQKLLSKVSINETNT